MDRTSSLKNEAQFYGAGMRMSMGKIIWVFNSPQVVIIILIYIKIFL